MPPTRPLLPLFRLQLQRTLLVQNPRRCVVHARLFSGTRAVRSSDGHSYDPPSGWLFGVPPGEKYQKEGWENVWIYGFWGSCLFGVVGYIYKPDTSIQTWALEEARRRLEVEGILPDPNPNPTQNP